jgi:hypothetical protein
MQYRLRRADGDYRWMSGRAEPMRDDRGDIVQWFGLCHDIDDQMRLYSDIAEREAKIRRLVQRFHETDRLHGLPWDSLVRWPVVALFFDSLDEIEDHGGMAAGI